MYIKKKDQVKVITGKDKNKTGEVLKVDRLKNKVLVSKINMIKKNVKSTNDNPGGIIERENFINVSNVMLLCSKCGSTTKYKAEVLSDNRKVRLCKKCGEIII